METQELEPQLARCEVTGNMVPEDELVTINGQRVCAEGKAILLDRLRAGEAMPGELEKPTVGRRFGCIFLDGLILGIPTAIVSGIIAAGRQGPMVLGAFSIFATAAQLFYFGQMHGTGGRTVGKKAGRLEVVNLDGSKVSLRTAYVRAVAYVGPSLASGIATLIGTVTALQIASVIVGAYGIVNVLFALFDRQMQRALHDRIAGTRVIYTA